MGQKKYMCMEEMIYRFLDQYLGDKVFSRRRWGGRDGFHIYSRKNNVLMFTIIPHGNNIMIYRGDELCETVASFFGVWDDEVMNHVKIWFGRRHNLRSVEDVLKFSPC